MMNKLIQNEQHNVSRHVLVFELSRIILIHLANPSQEKKQGKILFWCVKKKKKKKTEDVKS